MVLYSDRVFCFENLTRLDAELDHTINNRNVSEFVRNDIRNQQAFMELEHYSKHQTFLYIHPLTKHRKLTNELDALRKAAPQRFMTELVNADKSITRYKSLIKNGKAKDTEEQQKWKDIIEQYQEKLDIMRSLIQQ